MTPTPEPPPSPSEPPRSRPRPAKAAKRPNRGERATPGERPAPGTSVAASAPVAPSIQLHCAASWSPPATRVLALLDATKRDLNGVVRRAARLALATPPLYPALRAHLEGQGAIDYALDVTWLDDTEMHELNREHRGKDKPTDVLSFPLWEGEVFAQSKAQGVALGDLVISIDTAARQAQELNHSLRAEVAFLAIHGVLHLLGFDHGTDTERRQMWRQQDALFEELQSRLRSSLLKPSRVQDL